MSSDDFVPPERPGPIGGARDKNRRKRVAKLESTATKLFLRHGIAGVSVEMLASGAKMAKGSFYRYAASKTALVSRLFDPLKLGIESAFGRCRGDLSSAERSGLPGIYMALAADLTELVRTHSALVKLYLQESRAPASPERAAIHELSSVVRDGAHELTELAQERGLLSSIPAWLSSAVVVGAAEELLLHHLFGAKDRDVGEVQVALVSMVLNGITSWEAGSP